MLFRVIGPRQETVKKIVFSLQPVLIENAGYPSETHMVTTDDGYILTMHRIPYSKDDPDSLKSGETNKTRPVVFIVYTFLAVSADPSWCDF